MPTDLSQTIESLISCPNTKVLRHNHFGGGREFQNDPFNFKFLDGNRFPPLRELSLDGYDFGDFRLVRGHVRSDHTEKAMKPMLLESSDTDYLPPSQTAYIPGANLDGWKAAMDWTALHTLTLANIDNIFFWKMKGHLPALKDLSIRDNQGRSNVSDYMTDFITALNPMSRLSAYGYANSVNWSQVLDRHGSTLERLEIQEWNAKNSEKANPTLSPAQIEEISRRCPRLNEFSININRGPEISDDALDALTSFRNVSKLTIRLRSNQLIQRTGTSNFSYDLSDDSEPINDNFQTVLPFIGSRTILELFQNLRLRKQGAELLQLEVHVGNYDLRWGRNRPYLTWAEDYTSQPSKHTCDVLNENGDRKIEGEAWCRCEGICTKRETVW